MSDNAVKQITTDDLKGMEDREGLILQGCGGDPQEWVDGINVLLTEAGIMRNGSAWKAETVRRFEHDGLTNLLFPFEGMELDMGRLAMWRLQTHNQFGGTWLSDYVPNRLGGFVREQAPQRPLCPLIGQNGNIYNLMGLAAATLRENGMEKKAGEMLERITGGSCHSYAEALRIISEYVEPTDSLTERDHRNKNHHKKARNTNER